MIWGFGPFFIGDSMAEIKQFPGTEPEEEVSEYWECGECGGAIFYLWETEVQCVQCGTGIEDIRVVRATPNA